MVASSSASRPAWFARNELTLRTPGSLFVDELLEGFEFASEAIGGGQVALDTAFDTMLHRNRYDVENADPVAALWASRLVGADPQIWVRPIGPGETCGERCGDGVIQRPREECDWALGPQGGACPVESICNKECLCELCISSCDGKVCGDDGCGGSCGECGDGVACVEGGCEGGDPPCTTDEDCDNGNLCTDDRCVPEIGCVHVNNSAPCEDGNPCTAGDRCQDGACAAGAPQECIDDGNPCTHDLCDPESGACHVPVQDGTECEDGDLCTEGDTCHGGECVAGPAIECPPDGNVCTLDECDSATGRCHGWVPDGAPCDDGFHCTTEDTCVFGECSAGGIVACPDDGNECTLDICNSENGLCDLNATFGHECDAGDPASSAENPSAPFSSLRAAIGTLCRAGLRTPRHRRLALSRLGAPPAHGFETHSSIRPSSSPTTAPGTDRPYAARR